MLHDISATRTGASDIRSYLAEQERKTMLRFLTCGSVDDGKSTLIGRLLYDARLVFEDQLATLQRDSARYGTADEELDFALLVDGLEAEREQGITIDVAYRFFATAKRKFIVADTPGHLQYTRNMATGASIADLAIVLVDARRGVLPQTKRHSYIASLLGIRHILLAVNKIDLVGHDQAVFEEIAESYRKATAGLGFASVVPIPVSARYGINVAARSPQTSWYEGPTMVEHLENIEVDEDGTTKPFRFPIQYVNRPNLDFRGFAGTIASGTVERGAEIVVAKSGKTSRVKRIVSAGGDLEAAREGQAVTLVLEDEIEASRGNLLTAPDARPHVSDQLAASIVWFGEQAMASGRQYILRTETDSVSATVTELKHRINIDDFAHETSKTLEINEVGVCNLSLQAPIAFDNFIDNRATGAFVLIDRISNATVAAGMILHPLRRAENIHWQALDVDKAARAAQKHQKPLVLWFTGLSGTGKSTIANLLERKLHASGKHTYLLDGDNVRHGLNRDLGFAEADRVENIRRVGEVAKLMADAGLIVLASFISPFRAERDSVRELLPAGEFVEIFVDTPLAECAERDPKGLYRKAKAGELTNFTGIDSRYEAPEHPEVRLETVGQSPEETVAALESWLIQNGYC